MVSALKSAAKDAPKSALDGAFERIGPAETRRIE